MPFSLAPYIYKVKNAELYTSMIYNHHQSHMLINQSLCLQNWIFGSVLCKITPFIQGTSVCVSVLTLLVVSLDRFYAIYRPMKARIIVTRIRVYVAIVLIWLVAIAISSPLIFVNYVTEEGIEGLFHVSICEEKWPNTNDRNIYNLSVFILLYTAPLLVMTVAYATTGKILWSGDQQLHKESQ